MGCSTCSSNKNSTNGVSTPAGCKSNGNCGTSGCGILESFDWLSNVYYDDHIVIHEYIEVKFKGTRKEYYLNNHNLELYGGDFVIVNPYSGFGFDLGIVSLTGPLVKLQMIKNRVKIDALNSVLRLANDNEIQKYEELKQSEHQTMVVAKRISQSLNLNMKISDAEFQADRAKVTFYYTAEGRVDFRELIRLLSKEFKTKIEMRQIGMRQEAGRLGGIGSCGRTLCCSTWLTDFTSVPTSAAKYQNLFLNPLKLAGQCGRLKCCLNFELDTYMEALKDFPNNKTIINTNKGRATVEKLDILKGIIWFALADVETPTKLIPISLAKVKEMIELNKQGKVIEDFVDDELNDTAALDIPEFRNVLEEENFDRFDKKRRSQSKNRKPQYPLKAPNKPQSNTTQKNTSQPPQSQVAKPNPNPNKKKKNYRKKPRNNDNEGKKE
jgi:cell fate regulator YaaT (PSP1 superfamily)